MSDFRDAYDHWFPYDFMFVRNSLTNVSRRQMFDIFQDIGLDLPACGSLHKLIMHYSKFIVYSNEFSHCGTGKHLFHVIQSASSPYLLRIGKTWEVAFGDLLASEYVDDIISTSFRYISIAGKGYWMQYTSDHPWKSNCGNVDISDLTYNIVNLSYIQQCCSRIKNPLFAIDFVAARSMSADSFLLLAIDLNTAPLIANTPAHAFFKSVFGGNKGIADAIVKDSMFLTDTGVFDNGMIRYDKIHWNSYE